MDNDGCELLNTYHKIKRQAAFAIQLQKTTRMKYYSSQITTACDWQQPDQERNKNLVTEPLQEKGGNKTETKGEAEQTTVAKSKNFREKDSSAEDRENMRNAEKTTSPYGSL